MRNRLGLALVLAYFAHVIASVAYAATITDDPKGQAVWLAAPIMFTPSWLFDLLPSVTGPRSYATWHLQTLVRYPVGFSFCCIVLYLTGGLFQRIWLIGRWSSAAVGASIGLAFGSLWFVVTTNHSAIHSAFWFALGPVGALLGFFLHSKHIGLKGHP